ncbi:MAG: FkbM family methyltransferase [Magnetospirillum sp. WYHS-4]
MNKAPAAEASVAIRRGRHGHFMYLRGDAYVGRSLELYGEYSEDEVLLFRQFVKPGAVVVEAGANIGALTIPLARLAGPTGRVVAIEPQRALFNVLCGNLALNGLLNVVPLRAAAGRVAGQTILPVFPYHGKGNYGGVSVGDIQGAEAREAIAVIALDDLKLPRLDLLKIDVEGSESEVLVGTAETIRRLRPALYVENDRREKSAALIALLQEMDYALWWHLPPLFRVDNFHRNPDNIFGVIVSINLLALPREKGPSVQGLRPVAGAEDWWRVPETIEPSAPTPKKRKRKK